MINMCFPITHLGFIHTCNLLGANYLLNNGLYCTKYTIHYWPFSPHKSWPNRKCECAHLVQYSPLFNEYFMSIKSHVWIDPLSTVQLITNSTCPINRKCEWTLRIDTLTAVLFFVRPVWTVPLSVTNPRPWDAVSAWRYRYSTAKHALAII